MGFQDRDYHRKRSDDDDADDRYEPDDQDAEYEPDDDGDDLVEDDPDAPDARDVGSDGDEPEFIACPNCGKMIAEDAEQCHKCGHYLLDEEVSGGKPLIWVVVVVLLVVAMVWAYL